MKTDLDALIAQARANFDEVEPTDVELLIDGEQLTFRLRRLDGPEWRDLVAQHPPRPRTPQDINRGYNLTGVSRAYPRVILVEDDTETDAADKWADITSILEPADMELVEYTVWGINEYDPVQRAAGKVRKGESSN